MGTVREVSRVTDRDGFSDLRARFDIETPLKNSPEKSNEVFTSAQGTACGLRFEEGARYLVFAYVDDSKMLQTNICTRTRRVTSVSSDDEVEVLRSVAKGRLEARIYGTVRELIRDLYPLTHDYWAARPPMKGVRVTVRSARYLFEAESDVEGRFSFSRVPPGEYRVFVGVPPGYKVGGDWWDESTKEERGYYKNLKVTVTATHNPDPIGLEVRVDGRISGRVLTRSGEAVGKDIPVTLVTKATADQGGGDVHYVPAYTDSKGRFEFFGIPEGEYYLGLNIETRPHKSFPYARTYYPATPALADAQLISLKKSEKLTGFNIHLPDKVPEVELTGIVVDGSGQPVRNADVEAYGMYNAPWREEDGYSMKSVKQPTLEGRVKTDENGAFVIGLLKGNRYQLNAFLFPKPYKTLLKAEAVEIEATTNKTCSE